MLTEEEVKIKLLEVSKDIVCAGPVDAPEEKAGRVKEIYRQLIALYNEKI